MIILSDIVKEILDKTSNLYLGWVNRSNLNIKVIGVEPNDETETHHNYLMGLPPEWRNQSDVNLARWRYRKDLNVVYWWEFNHPTEDEKNEVSQWVMKNLSKSTPIHKIISTNRNSIEFRDSHEN